MNFLRIIRNWRRWIGFVVIVAYLLLLCIALPLCIWELEKKGTADHVEAWFVGGVFVMMALPISLWGILQHVLNYTCPHLQRHIIRILWMVPVYALNAWFALRFPSAAIYLDTLRECYEAYVIYNFMAYLLSFLRHDYPHLDIQIENKPPVKHIFPLCLLPPCQNGIHFLKRCKHGVLQYTIVRPTMTLIALFCEMFDKYGEGDFNFTTAWSYLAIVNNVSQVIAMYCLVLFYRAFKEELKPIKPVPKFICVKVVVFVSFWQMVLISALSTLDLLPQNGTWIFYKNMKQVATGVQDFLICIEMFLAAIAHYFSFSHKPFVDMAAEQRNCCWSFMSMWNISDVTEDVVEHARYVGGGVHKRLFKNLMGRGEQSPLLNSESSPQDSSDADQPATLIGNDDAHSISDSINGRHYSTFATRSTTSSMNNYAEFSTSVDVIEEKGTEQPVNLLAYEGSEDEIIEEEKSMPNRSDLTRSKDLLMSQSETHRILSPRSSLDRNNDNDAFEHLEQVEDLEVDAAVEEEILNGDSIPTEQNSFSYQTRDDPVV